MKIGLRTANSASNWFMAAQRSSTQLVPLRLSRLTLEQPALNLPQQQIIDEETPMTRLLEAFSALTLTCLTCQPTLAAEVTQTVDTSASPTKVWALIGKFEDIVNWLPGVTSSPSDKGSKVGAVRTITLKAPGDPKVVEKLTAHNNHAHSYSYEILKVNPKVLPVSAYTSTISVSKSGGGSTVTWHGSFKPAGGADDVAAEKAVGGLYKSGLDNVKTLTEK